MYLIKVEMARYLPEVRHALADCQKMHQLVTGLFDAARQDANILYRTNFVADQLHGDEHRQSTAQRRQNEQRLFGNTELYVVLLLYQC